MTNTTTKPTAFCSNCGSPNAGGRFCAACGTPMASEGAQAASTPNAAPGPRPGPGSSYVGAPGDSVPRLAAAAQVAAYIDLPGLGAVELATIGQRAAARALDVVIVAVGSLVVLAIFGALTSAIVGGGGSGVGGTAAGFLGFIGEMFFVAILAYLYEVIMIAMFGRTLGKTALGIRVVRELDGAKPNVGNALMRFLAPAIASGVPILGFFLELLVFLSPIFDASGRRQGWHDKFGGTVVIAGR